MKTTFDKQKVYDILRIIPKGKVLTYGKLAEMLGNKRWARSVGNALHSNPDGDLYPCYKIVTCDGKLSTASLFGGVEVQRKRLEADGIEVKRNKVDLKKYLWI